MLNLSLNNLGKILCFLGFYTVPFEGVKIPTLPVVCTETFPGSPYHPLHILHRSLVGVVGKESSPGPPRQIGSRREIGNLPGRQVCAPTTGLVNLRENTNNSSLQCLLQFI